MNKYSTNCFQNVVAFGCNLLGHLLWKLECKYPGKNKTETQMIIALTQGLLMPTKWDYPAERCLILLLILFQSPPTTNKTLILQPETKRIRHGICFFTFLQIVSALNRQESVRSPTRCDEACALIPNGTFLLDSLQTILFLLRTEKSRLDAMSHVESTWMSMLFPSRKAGTGAILGLFCIAWAFRPLGRSSRLEPLPVLFPGGLFGALLLSGLLLPESTHKNGHHWICCHSHSLHKSQFEACSFVHAMFVCLLWQCGKTTFSRIKRQRQEGDFLCTAVASSKCSQTR